MTDITKIPVTGPISMATRHCLRQWTEHLEKNHRWQMNDRRNLFQTHKEIEICNDRKSRLLLQI